MQAGFEQPASWRIGSPCPERRWTQRMLHSGARNAEDRIGCISEFKHSLEYILYCMLNLLYDIELNAVDSR